MFAFSNHSHLVIDFSQTHKEYVPNVVVNPLG